MGIDLYLYEVLDKSEESENFLYLMEVPHIRRIFKDKVFMRKLDFDYPTKLKEPFRKRNLRFKDWNYYGEDEEVEFYENRKTGGRINIPAKEFGWKKDVKVPVIKVKEVVYRSGSSKLTAFWHGLDDFISDNFPRIFQKLRHLTKKKDLETFIDNFVVRRYRKDLKVFLDNFTDKNIFVIDW